MIKQFKQHIVPFVITTRKIFTVIISIVFYNHKTTPFQIVAIVLIFLTASYEYLSEIYGPSKHVPLPVSGPPSQDDTTTMIDEEISNAKSE